MTNPRKSGIIAHPTAFPSPYGIGDLGQGTLDFLDFLHESGCSLWQVLPLGPTSYGDSPYQSFSTFGGNPLLISPEGLVAMGLLPQNALHNPPAFPAERVDFSGVYTYKNALLAQAFLNFIPDSAYEVFCAKNKFWLDDYALFRALKDHFIVERQNQIDPPELALFQKENQGILEDGFIRDNFYGGSWLSFPKALRNRAPYALIEWTKKLAEQVAFHQFTQYLFYQQWGKVRGAARERGIEIIGDIPIFVAFDSADVWSNPQLFQLDDYGCPTKVAGVPPDYFSATGQLWGNPLYRWPAHEADGFGWWVQRIASTLELVDILRIDHFRGFEAYWAVDFGAENAILGHWNKAPGRPLFTAIHKQLGDLPIIAEDLGIITPDVTALRQAFHLPGMKVLQFAFGAGANSPHLPHNYTEARSVCYSGTHDNDTAQGWFASATDEEKDHVRRYLNVSGNDIAWDLCRLAFSCVSQYALVPVQDILNLGAEHRMNTPGKPQGNWQFRFGPGALQTHHAQGLLYLNQLYNRLPNPVDLGAAPQTL